MSREDHEQTRRHFDVVAESLRSDMRFLAEGLAMTNDTLERFREELTDFKAETGRNFAGAHAELATFKAETGRNFANAHAELAAFKAETARNFGDVRAELGASHSEVDRRLKAVESR
jgi:hypothetical protein